MRRVWPLMIRRVVGQSMEPTLPAGTLVIGYCWARGSIPSSVVMAQMNQRQVIKRVHSVMPEGVSLLGDNPAFSTDSRQRGLVQPADIRAVVIWPRKL